MAEHGINEGHIIKWDDAEMVDHSTRFQAIALASLCFQSKIEIVYAILDKYVRLASLAEMNLLTRSNLFLTWVIGC